MKDTDVWTQVRGNFRLSKSSLASWQSCQQYRSTTRHFYCQNYYYSSTTRHFCCHYYYSSTTLLLFNQWVRLRQGLHTVFFFARVLKAHRGFHETSWSCSIFCLLVIWSCVLNMPVDKWFICIQKFCSDIIRRQYLPLDLLFPLTKCNFRGVRYLMAGRKASQSTDVFR